MAAEVHPCCPGVAARLGKATPVMLRWHAGTVTGLSLWWVNVFLQSPMTLPPPLLKCNCSLHTTGTWRSAHRVLSQVNAPRNPCKIQQQLKKKIEGNNWKAFPCLFLCPGARQRYEKGCCSECWLHSEQWLEPASPVALDYFNYPALCGLF